MANHLVPKPWEHSGSSCAPAVLPADLSLTSLGSETNLPVTCARSADRDRPAHRTDSTRGFERETPETREAAPRNGAERFTGGQVVRCHGVTDGRNDW